MSVYVVIVRYVTRLVRPEEIDEALTGKVQDWFRFNGLTWLVQTSMDASQVSALVNNVLTRDDSVAVLKVDLSDFHGWAPSETWTWLQSKMTLSDFMATKNRLAGGTSLGGLAGLGAKFPPGSLGALMPPGPGELGYVPPAFGSKDDKK
jgi:hypothetical protein